MPKCNQVPGIERPSDNLEKLAQYAVGKDKQEFRKKALSLAGFYKTVTEELDSGVAQGAYDCLSEEDRRFCETWVYLARLTFYDKPNGKVKDEMLVKTIRRHLAKDGGPDIDGLSG